LKVLRSLHDWLTEIGFLMGLISLALMCSLYCMEVVLRYFLTKPNAWSVEAVSYGLLMTIFLMMPHAVRRGSHISVDLVSEVIPSFRPYALYVIYLIGGPICTFVAWISLQENIRQFSGMIETTGNYPLPKWWFSAFITYGFANAALWHFRLIFDREPQITRMPILRKAES